MVARRYITDDLWVLILQYSCFTLCFQSLLFCWPGWANERLHRILRGAQIRIWGSGCSRGRWGGAPAAFQSRRQAQKRTWRTARDAAQTKQRCVQPSPHAEHHQLCGHWSVSHKVVLQIISIPVIKQACYILSGKEIKRLKPKRAASFFTRQVSAPAYSAVQVRESLEQSWTARKDQTWWFYTEIQRLDRWWIDKTFDWFNM